MARATKKYRLFPRANGAIVGWNKIGALTNKWEELATAEQEEDFNGSGKNPGAGHGLSIEETGKQAQLLATVLKLAEGERVIGLTVNCYGKPTSNKGFKFGINNPTETLAEATGAAETKWRTVSLSKAEAEKLNQAQLNELTLILTTTGGKATKNEVFSLYAEVETETESASLFRQSGQKASTAPGGGGSVSVAIENASVGNYLMVGVLTAIGIAGPTSITDSGSNTYILDSELKDGVHPTIQHWRAKVGTATTEVKANGLGSLVLVDIVVVEVTPLSTVDTSGTNSGVTAVASTELEVATVASLQAGKGDFAISWFGTTGSLGTFTAGAGMTQLTGADQTGLSLGGQYTSTPAEGATLTAKGTFSVTGTWSAAVIAYKTTSGTKVQKLEATMSFAGVIPRNTAHQLPAGLTFTGTLPRAATYQLGAALSLAGSLSKNTSHGFASSLSFAGALKRSTTHGLTASLTPSGSIGRNTTHGLPAGLSFAGSLGRTIRHAIAASISPAGSLPRNTSHQLPAGLSFSGTLPRAITRVLAAVLSPTGELPRNTTHQNTASLSFQATLGRRVTIPFNAALSFAGALIPKAGQIIQRFTASLAFQGTVGRNTRKQLPAALTFQARIPKTIRRPLAASLSFVGGIRRVGAKALGLAGRVNPRSRAGTSAPLDARLVGALTPRKGLYPRKGLLPTVGTPVGGRGRVNPRPAHVKPGLTPKARLYPRKGLHPKGPSIDPD